MTKLTDILNRGDLDSLSKAWTATDAADDFGVLPAGDYVTHIIAGELTNSRSKGTPGYKLTFEVIEGEYAKRRIWHDIWLTPAAIAMAKRDLRKLGVENPEQLSKPLPPGFRCRVSLAIRRTDEGTEYNRVKRFDVLGIDQPERDAFAPDDEDANAGYAGGEPQDGDTSFSPDELGAESDRGQK